MIVVAIAHVWNHLIILINVTVVAIDPAWNHLIILINVTVFAIALVWNRLIIPIIVTVVVIASVRECRIDVFSKLICRRLNIWIGMGGHIRV